MDDWEASIEQWKAEILKDVTDAQVNWISVNGHNQVHATHCSYLLVVIRVNFNTK